MNGAQFGREPERRLVTQDEAAAMVALWSRHAEEAASGLLELRDVAETLHISESDASALLAQVRRSARPAKRPMAKPLAAVLCFFLAMSLISSATAVCILGSDLFHGRHFEAIDAFCLWLHLAWVLGWITYYRRPLARAFGGVARRIETGKP